MPNRFGSIKKPKATVKKTHFKPKTIIKRRKAFYTTGKGSVGVLIRLPRLVKLIRCIRKEQNERYKELTGDESTAKRSVLFKSFPKSINGALDAYANRLMEFAEDHAKYRRKPGSKKGLKLRKTDLEFAVYWSNIFAK